MAHESLDTRVRRTTRTAASRGRHRPQLFSNRTRNSLLNITNAPTIPRTHDISAYIRKSLRRLYTFPALTHLLEQIAHHRLPRPVYLSRRAFPPCTYLHRPARRMRMKALSGKAKGGKSLGADKYRGWKFRAPDKYLHRPSDIYTCTASVAHHSGSCARVTRAGGSIIRKYKKRPAPGDVLSLSLSSFSFFYLFFPFLPLFLSLFCPICRCSLRAIPSKLQPLQQPRASRCCS